MALLWEHTGQGRRYEIRAAGRSLRLYTNGVLHSHYHSDYLFNGGVWDLLGLPALWNRGSRLSGVLLLGLGGGVVVRQLHELIEWNKFIAVDNNAVHLEISRRFFGLDDIPATLVKEDARRWVATHPDGKFDLIIDDLFSDHNGEARRAVAFSRTWCAGLCERLTDDGTLVVNFADVGELKRRLRKCRPLKREFKRIYQFTVPAYGNAVAVLLRNERSPAELTAAVKAIKPRRRRARLRYDIKRIEPA